MTSALRRGVIDIRWAFFSLGCGRRAGRGVVPRGPPKWDARAFRPGNRGQYSKTPGEASGIWQHAASIVAANARAQGRLVSRFRSSPELAARSNANFGIEGH